VYKIDEAVKIQKYMFFAIPVKAGIQVYQLFIRFPDSGFHRGDRFIFLNAHVLGFESARGEFIPVSFRAAGMTQHVISALFMHWLLVQSSISPTFCLNLFLTQP
jgi:hypothetical protein